MLVTATRRGWDATGVEPHGDARHVACCLPDATIHQCAFEDYRSDEPFGLITCIDVLEHLRRPDDALAHMAELLHPGGVVMITTIDVKGLGANVLGTRWPHFHRDHLWYFDRRSLQRLAEKAGLHVVSCNRAKKCFQLDYLLRIMSHAEMFPTGQRCARLGLSLLPRWLRTRRFVLPEGLLLVARKPPGTTAQR
jgi:SAM-dependent methyltransferase